jgi:CRP-like cAMP-binding protein
MSVAEIVAALARTVLFHGLSDSELKRLAAIARMTALPAGTILFNQGDGSDGLYVITSGIVRIYLTSSDGREATISLAEQGDVIGEMALLDGLPRSAGAAALTDARLIFIQREPFLALLESSTLLGRQIIITLCERLRATNTQVDQAIFHDLRHRLLVLLRQIALLHGRLEGDMAVVELDVTQGTLAQMLGASREAVNKHLRALAREGCIAVAGHKIEIYKTPRTDVGAA